jgi:hypothetical protein
MTNILAVAMLGTALAYPASSAPDAQWAATAKALGKSGTEMPGGVYRVGIPRTDLQVALDGVTLKPTFALGSWVAFAPMGHDAMVMGDLVLTEDEIAPVMKKLKDEGIEITALHNHLLRVRPATFYMHIHGHGQPEALAQFIHDALALSKTPLGDAAAAPPAQQSSQPQIDLDMAMIDRTFGAPHGQIAGGVYQITIPRAETIKDGGMTVPPPMGTAEAINFQPMGGGKAVITGDFVLIAKEVTPVQRALLDNGIEVTALHSHMVGEQPRLYFMHFWANDDSAKLAKGLRAALDKLNLGKKVDVANK